MGRVIKFQSKHKQDNSNITDESNNNTNVKQFGLSDFEISLRKALEDYILSTFAVKNVLGMNILFKVDKSNIGILGVVKYEHKRKAGIYVANFISEATNDKGNIKVIEVAFESGERELYKSIYNILKAKKILPKF